MNRVRELEQIQTLLDSGSLKESFKAVVERQREIERIYYESNDLSIDIINIINPILIELGIEPFDLSNLSDQTPSWSMNAGYQRGVKISGFGYDVMTDSIAFYGHDVPYAQRKIPLSVLNAPDPIAAAKQHNVDKLQRAREAELDTLKAKQQALQRQMEVMQKLVEQGKQDE